MRWHLQLWRWEPINRHAGELYLRRLRVVTCQWFGLYIHWFHASDDDCLHDHPWSFLTVILRGGYWEHTPGPNNGVVKRWYPPFSIRVRPAGWLHRIEIDPVRKPVTLVLRGPRVRSWGFSDQQGMGALARVQGPQVSRPRARSDSLTSCRCRATIDQLRRSQS